MSRLDDLLQNLCPDGVEFVPLGQVLDYSQPTPYIVKSTRYEDLYDTPVLTAGASFILGYTDETKGIYVASRDKPVIIFDDFTTSFHWVDFKFKVKSSAMKILTEVKQRPAVLRYIFYAMQCITYQPSNHARQWIQTYSKIQIPLPPLPVQEEIVRILDTFSGVVAELEQKLEAEQAARTKQYDHYRNELLSFDSNSKIMEKLLTDYSLNGVEFKNLGEICNVTTGKLNANAMKDDGKYPFFTCAREVYRIDNYAFNTEALLVSGNGSQVGHIHYYNGKFNAYQRTYVLDKFTENISYIRHVLRAFLKQRILEEVNVSGVPYIKLDTLTDFLIPIPPREIQDQIVSILDRFDTLVNDLKSGLPAEIALRRKQYEYYRDKLLNFKPLE